MTTPTRPERSRIRLALSLLSPMVSPRSLTLGLGLGATAARAQSAFPNRPVRWIIPTSPGAGTDVSARIFAQIASEAWKQPTVPDNRAGASGMLGLDALANVRPTATRWAS